jgi:hypothetical protein
MLTFGVFGIDNDALNTAVNVLILVLIVVWAALVFWTFADARRRIDDPMLVGCATLASLFPFVGTIIYAIVRPPEYLDDVRLPELHAQAEGALPLVRQGGRPRLAPVPLLRGRDRGRSAVGDQPPAPPRLDDVRGRRGRGQAALLALTNDRRRSQWTGP